MLQQKRIRKPPEPLALQYPPYSKKTKDSKAKRKLKRCTYQTISYPSKLIYTNKIYCFYADVIMLEENGSLIFEPSLLNRFLKYESVEVKGESNRKLLRAKVEKKKGLKIPQWNQVVKKLKATREPNMMEWAKLIRDFCEKYEEVIQIESSNLETDIKMCEEEPSIYFDRAKAEAEKTELLETYPCICFKSSFGIGRNGVSEVIFNQQFLEEINYPLELFASTILEEGIPQLLPHDINSSDLVLKIVLERYFSVEESSYSTPEIFSHLFTRDSYMKDIIFKVHFFPSSYKDNLGAELMLVFLKIGDPYQGEQLLSKNRLNKNYLEKMLTKEKETNYFLSIYYNDLLPFHLTNPDKVCGIKEIFDSEECNDDYDFYEKVEVKSEDL